MTFSFESSNISFGKSAEHALNSKSDEEFLNKIKSKEIRFSPDSPAGLFSEDDGFFSNSFIQNALSDKTQISYILTGKDAMFNDDGQLLDDSFESYIEYPSYIDDEGTKVYEGDYPKDFPAFNMFCEPVNAAKYTDIYDSDGDIVAKTLCDENGNYIASKFYELNSKGEVCLAVEEAYSKDGNAKITKTYESDGQYFTLTLFDNKNNQEKHTGIDSAETAQNILKRNILNYEQFSPQDICTLAQLKDSSWQSAEKFLEQNPNANLNDILRKI